MLQVIPNVLQTTYQKQTFDPPTKANPSFQVDGSKEPMRSVGAAPLAVQGTVPPYSPASAPREAHSQPSRARHGEVRRSVGGTVFLHSESMADQYDL